MANILDYVKSNQRTFAEEKLNELDSLVFAELTYCHFEKIKNINSFKSLDLDNNELIANLTSNVWKQEKMEKLISLLIKSRRFRDVTWSNIVNKIEAKSEFEFNAVTFHFRPQAVYVAYRGTTATKVGWKEDFNMSFLDSVPAQFFARQYFRKILQQTQGKIFLGGHSKGGNLAFYVALTATKEEQESIIRVDNFDGPGFHNQKERFDKKIKALLPKLHKFIPQGCLVGTIQDDLIDDRQYCKIVQAQGIPPMQHNLFNWKIERDHFLWAKCLAYPADFS